ncbi:MAG: TonB-dependent receptor [Pseudomonadota bacterium]
MRRILTISIALGLATGLASAVAQTPAPIETIEIFGKGQTRQVQNITRSDLADALPGTSPLKVLQKLPGVSFQSSDAFGAYEWSTRLSVRGFSQGQLGFTLDDIPLGNMSYGNNNGLHISRAIIPENIRRVDLSQGSGAVGTASTSNLGGAVQFVSNDPQDAAGIRVSQTVGSNHMRRSFVRIDSGLLAEGAKLTASAVRQHGRKWKGEGVQDLTQFNSRLVQDSGPNRLEAFYNYADRSENDYQDLSLDMRERLGWEWDNYAPDWERAVQAARGVFSGGVTNRDDAYYTARGLRKDHLGGAALRLENQDASLRLKASAYFHRNDGQGHWYTPYTASSATVPISIRTTEYAVRRHGVLADLSWKTGMHTVNGGFWFERNLHDVTRNFYAVSGPEDSNRFLDNPMLTAYMQRFRVRTAQFHVQDSFALQGGRLRINAGIKHPSVTIEATSINRVRAAGTLKARKGLLPQVGLNYDLNDNAELFASVSRNLRAFEAGVYGQFSQSQAAFDANGAKLKPETSVSADLGLRFTRRGVSGSVALYRADFRDRLLSVATCAGVVGCPNTVVNVGRVNTSGLEAAASLALARNWTWFNSLTLNRSRYGSDYLDNGAVVAVGGKQVVDAPARLMQTELAFDNKRWFVKLGGKYTSQRYYTYTNDGWVSPYTVWDLGAGLRRGGLTFQVNLNNVFDKRYFSTIGSNQFAASDPRGRFATMLTGAPRELFVTVSGNLR